MYRFFIILSTLIVFACQRMEKDCKGKVIAVLDGDTFDFSCQEGWNAGKVFRVRLADIDGPEFGEPNYENAKNFLKKTIMNKAVVLDIDNENPYDPHNRVIAVAYVHEKNDQWTNVNKLLLDKKYAVAVEYDNEFSPKDW